VLITKPRTRNQLRNERDRARDERAGDSGHSLDGQRPGDAAHPLARRHWRESGG